MRAALPKRLLSKSPVSVPRNFSASARPIVIRQATSYICQSCRCQIARSDLPIAYTKRFQSTATATKSNTIETPFATSTPQTHYDFFPNSLPNGPPPSGAFTIGLRALRKEFLQLQAKAHPDLHASKDKARAEALSSRINEAYRTLSDPLLRTQYLLRLEGIEVESETDKTDDKELLMSVMEVREAVEDAESEQELEGLKSENEERIQESLGRIEKGFVEGDLETVREEAVRLRYWRNCEESLKNWEKGKGVVLEH